MPVSTIATNRAVTYAGAVLQVVQATTSTSVASSSMSYIDSGLSASITPTSSTSKILVMVSQSTRKSAANASNGLDFKLFRGSTDLGRLVYAYGYSGTAIDNYGVVAFQYLDSPATTSSTTYKTQFANLVNGNTVSCQADSIGVSMMTLLEIAA